MSCEDGKESHKFTRAHEIRDNEQWTNTSTEDL